MTRIILAEGQGNLLPTGGDEVLRSVGNPVDGVCTFDDGTEARL